MKLDISHRTVYRYDVRMRHSTQYLRLTPSSSRRQRVLSWQLGLPARASSGRDPYGNCQHVLTLDYPHHEVSVLATGQVEVLEPLQEDDDDGLSPGVFLRHTALTASSPALTEFALGLAGAVAAQSRQGLWQLMERLADAMPLRNGHASTPLSAAQAFALACGDSHALSHAFISAARVLGKPARHVSGYVLDPHTGEVSPQGWAEVWLEGRWASYDVQHGQAAGPCHVKLAVGMDYLDACPVRGQRMANTASADQGGQMLPAAQQSAQQ